VRSQAAVGCGFGFFALRHPGQGPHRLRRATRDDRVPCAQEPSRSTAVKVVNPKQGSKRSCDDETRDLAGRCCLIIAVRTCRPGVGAARHCQSGLVRPVLSERKLPELRARKPLHELWLAASGTSFPLGPSASPPPLALTPAGEPPQALHWSESGKAEARRQVGSITRLGHASTAFARGDLWQGQAESIGQPAPPGLRQHR
jgi:hypothetical protein